MRKAIVFSIVCLLVLPAGSSMVKLETRGEERRPIVSETPID